MHWEEQESSEIKQVIVVRSNIKMGKGKTAAQVAHASLLAFISAQQKDDSITQQWLSEGGKKVVVKIADEKQLVELCDAVKRSKIPCALVTDAGHTQLEPGTRTTLGIGPWYGAKIDKFTASLKLL